MTRNVQNTKILPARDEHPSSSIVDLLLRLTQSIAEAESFDAALSVTLNQVCATIGWDYGEAWILARSGSHLELGTPFYTRFSGMEIFHEASSHFEFLPGAGLPGRVWQTRQMYWVEDVTTDPDFLRAAYARRAGFKTAVGVPVIANDEIVTVLEFFSREARQKDERMVALSSAIMAQLSAAFHRKRTDEQLKLSEARLRESQRIAKMGNWELDPRSNRLVWSDEIFRIFEIDKNKFGESYEAFLNLIHPEDRDAVNRAYTNSLKTREPYEITHRLLMPDGRIKYVEERCENFFAPDGTPIRSVGLVQEVTERKQAEEALRENEQSLRDAQQLSHIGNWNWTIATDTVKWSDELYRIAGRNSNLPTPRYAEIDSMYTPESWQRLNASVQEAIKSGTSYELDLDLVRPDGSVRHVIARGEAVMDAEPKIIGLRGTVQDITERKRAEREAEKLHNAVEQSADVIFITDGDGNIEYANPAFEAVTGYSRAESIGKTPRILRSGLMPAGYYQKAWQTIRAGTPFHAEVINRRRDGGTFYYDQTITPIKDVTGKITNFVSTGKDVTDRKKAEEALRDSEKRLREIVDAAPFGAHVYQINADGHLIFAEANQSADEILGVDHKAFIGRTFEEAFPYMIRTELSQMYRRAATQGIRYDLPRFNYKDSRLAAVFEIHIIQIAPGRIVSFFRNVSELDAAYDQTIVGWSRAMDLRDKETEEHTERVTQMAVEVARRVGLGEAELLYVRWGALLHDMGKIGVPDSILLKPGKLSEEEQALMRKHPDLAYEMLEPIRFLRPALDIPYCHHEKWDGTGYPRGLKGLEIPVAARIFALVDVWDALRSDRPYRKKWPSKKVVEYIRSLAGTHFDPALVDVFLDFVREDKPETG